MSKSPRKENRANADRAARRALRLGVFIGNRCIEERIFRPGRKVTVGQTLENDVVLPSSGAPRRHVLFEHADGGWRLRTAEFIGGRMAVGGDIEPLHRPEAGSRGEVIELGHAGRGRLDVGRVRLLFQLVDAPDRRRHLPAAFGGGGLLAGVSGFVGTGWIVALALSAVFQLIPLTWVMLSDWPEPEALQQVPDWYADEVVVVQDEEEEPPSEEEPIDKTGAVAETPLSPREAVPEPKKRQDKDSRDRKSETERADTAIEKRARKARGKRLVTEVFGVEGDESMGTAIANDVVGDNSAMAALNALDPRDIGKPEGKLALNLNGDGDPRGPELLEGPDCGDCDNVIPGSDDVVVDRAPQRKKISFEMRENIKLPPSTPKKPAKSIEAVFAKKRKQVENCYKRTMQKHGHQTGKVVVSATIGTERKALSVKISSDTIGKGLGRCIQAKIERWRFPALEAPVSVAKRWVFQ